MNLFSLKNHARVLMLSLLVGVSAYASHSDLCESENRFGVNGFVDPEIDYHVFSHLGARDHMAMSLVSKGINQTTTKHYQAISSHIYTSPLGINYTARKYYQDVSSDIYTSPFQREDVKEYWKPLIKKSLENELSEKSFLIIPHGSSFVVSLPHAHTPLNVTHLLDNFDSSASLYKACFGNDLKIEDPNLTKELHHLLTVLPVAGIFLDPENASKGAQNFFNIFGYKLSLEFSQISSSSSFWSFCADITEKDLKALSEKPHSIVMTGAEFESESNRLILKNLLAKNMDHTLLLDIDGSFVERNSGSGSYHLHKIFTMDNLSHLILTNRSHDIKEIPSSFMHYVPNLRTFHAVGFTQLLEIQDGVFLQCESLKFIDTSGFLGVKKIGSSFLASSVDLNAVDLRGLRYVQEIGSYLAHTCIGLWHLNLNHLCNLEKATGLLFSDCYYLPSDDRKTIRQINAKLGLTWRPN